MIKKGSSPPVPATVASLTPILFFWLRGTRKYGRERFLGEIPAVFYVPARLSGLYVSPCRCSNSPLFQSQNHARIYFFSIGEIRENAQNSPDRTPAGYREGGTTFFGVIIAQR